MTDLELSGLPVLSPTQRRQRLSLLIWGTSGCGKTTLAATAPGRKLWINFDSDGTESLLGRDDILVADFSREPSASVVKFREENPIRIEKFITDNDIDTVVFDSLTSYGEKALHYGVKVAQGTPKGRSATLEDPGFSGYGNKSTWTRLAVRNLLQSTGKLEKHCIFIAHEDKPTTNDSGTVLYISIMLGSSLNEQIPVSLSEVWHLSDTGKKRMLAVRSCRSRKPMKTRMFITSEAPEFAVEYDVETGKGEGIAAWYELWTRKQSKIPLPGSERYLRMRKELGI